MANHKNQRLRNQLHSLIINDLIIISFLLSQVLLTNLAISWYYIDQQLQDYPMPAYICMVVASCGNGDIRLMNGGHQYEGRLEVCINNQWGTVCDDFWKSNSNNARVACRQLGYSDIGKLCQL